MSLLDPKTPEELGRHFDTMVGVTPGVYRIEVQLAATAYVRATTAEEAKRLLDAETRRGWWLEIKADGTDISDCNYEDPALPGISLSPAMTVRGRWPGDDEAERVHP